MNKNFNYLQKYKKIITIFKSEFLNQFTLVKILLLLFSIAIPLISVTFVPNIEKSYKDLIGSDDPYFNKKIIKFSEYLLIYLILQQGIFYALMIRIGIILLEKNIVDKSRLIFLRFNKHIVTLSKIFIDVLSFIISISILAIVGYFIILDFLDGNFSSKIIVKIANALFGYVFFYLFISYGVRLIIVLFNSQTKVLIMFFWLTITIIYYVASHFMLFYQVFFLSINWLIYIPFLNLVVPFSFFWDVSNLQTTFIDMLPMIFTTMIFIGITWKKFVTKQKEYLCI